MSWTWSWRVTEIRVCVCERTLSYWLVLISSPGLCCFSSLTVWILISCSCGVQMKHPAITPLVWVERGVSDVRRRSHGANHPRAHLHTDAASLDLHHLTVVRGSHLHVEILKLCTYQTIFYCVNMTFEFLWGNKTFSSTRFLFWSLIAKVFWASCDWP